MKTKETYESITDYLFEDGYYRINESGNIILDSSNIGTENPNIAVNARQLERLLAINKMMTITKYVNKGWIPDWNNMDEAKYYFRIDTSNRIVICSTNIGHSELVYYRTPKLAEQAKNIMGEDMIRLTLSTDW